MLPRRAFGGSEITAEGKRVTKLDQILLNGSKTGHLAAVHKVRCDENLRAMADREDRLGLREEFRREIKHLVALAQRVRVEQAARNEKRVEIVGLHFVHGLVDLDLDAVLAVLIGLDLAALERDDDAACTGILQRLFRRSQLDFLKAVGGENGNGFSFCSLGHDVS